MFCGINSLPTLKKLPVTRDLQDAAMSTPSGALQWVAPANQSILATK